MDYDLTIEITHKWEGCRECDVLKFSLVIVNCSFIVGYIRYCQRLLFAFASAPILTYAMLSPSHPRPVPNGSLSFWRTQLDSLDNHRTTEGLPEVADIVVIGSGYAGASTVYHILDKSNAASKPSIVILEARQACSGATGRNGKFFDDDCKQRLG